jgi:hypothetical protein
VADKLAWSTLRRFEFPAAYGRTLKHFFFVFLRGYFKSALICV